MKRFAFLEGLPLEEFVSSMQNQGIDKAIVFTIEGFYKDYKRCNDELGQATRKYTDILYAFCTVDPKDGSNAVTEMQRCFYEYNMKGVKLHPWLQAFSAVDPIVFPIVQEAAKLDIPVLFNDGSPPYSDTLEVAYLAHKFPEAKIILGHSGQLDFYRLAIVAAQRNENIVLCTSSTARLGLQEIVDMVGAERIIFGSDFPFGGQSILKNEIIKIECLEITEEDRRKILCENARRLFKI
jgi:predicted TIM-barrel fold metal-dependent hydrolase